jgi:hypothetical protein
LRETHRSIDPRTMFPLLGRHTASYTISLVHHLRSSHWQKGGILPARPGAEELGGLRPVRFNMECLNDRSSCDTQTPKQTYEGMLIAKPPACSLYHLLPFKLVCQHNLGLIKPILTAKDGPDRAQTWWALIGQKGVKIQVKCPHRVRNSSGSPILRSESVPES